MGEQHMNCTRMHRTRMHHTRRHRGADASFELILEGPGQMGEQLVSELKNHHFLLPLMA